MGPFEAAASEYELNRYLRLLNLGYPSDCFHSESRAPFPFTLPEHSGLRDALDTYLELLRLRLDVQGAFLVLTDGKTASFLAGTPSAHPRDKGSESASWLNPGGTNLDKWLHVFQQTLSATMFAKTTVNRVLTLSVEAPEDAKSPQTNLSEVSRSISYLGTPITSARGSAIGTVFVISASVQEVFTRTSKEMLVTTAEKCLKQIDLTRESISQERWKRMNTQLYRFLGSRAVRDQLLEDPPSLSRTSQQRRRKSVISEIQALAQQNGREPPQETILSPDDESKRPFFTEFDLRERSVDKEETSKPQRPAVHADNERKSTDNPDETAYRKIFKRASECLQEALKADGVLFADGLIGFHGGVQPVPELENELEREMVQFSERTHTHPLKEDGTKTTESGSQSPIALSQHEDKHSEDQATGSRVYTSAEYRRGLHMDRPTEILGMYVRSPEFAPRTRTINETTLGLASLDEGFLQLMLDDHPDGSVWYLHDTTNTCYAVKNGNLIEEDLTDRTKLLFSDLEGARQILFVPMRDPVSFKRLAGCLVWSTQPLPVFDDDADLHSLRGFIHVLESEISRIDALASAKQKEGYVSSVSHELRTPLHGILGAVQLLADTEVDAFQQGLIDTIKASGSTLNDTLTSVLSYARINKFERQQHRKRERRYADEDWTLPDRMRLNQGPDVDFDGLYKATNIALLCEEITGVLDAGRSYRNTKGSHQLLTLVEIEHEENWNYFTEPGALRRIAANIIGNALKYTMEGSVVVTLDTSKPRPRNTALTKDTDFWRLITFSVRDTGKGISQDFLDNHLFVPFTQEDATGSHGVGLGMSIVKSLVTLLAGEIRVNSKQGEGTEVKITIPMRICRPDRNEVTEPSLGMERDIASIRDAHLSVALFGFPRVLRQGLENYLEEWFDCKVLEDTKFARPDIVMAEEGNKTFSEDIERAGCEHGRHCVLLSVVVAADALGKRMNPSPRYARSERTPRPIGPNSIRKALLACMSKLRELREESLEHEQKEHGHGQSEQGELEEQSQENNTSVEVGVSSSPEGRGQAEVTNFLKTPRSVSKRTSTDVENPPDKPFIPRRSRTSDTTPQRPQTNEKPSSLRVLVVEDNALNRKILGAFLKKFGYHHFDVAENGALAVDAIQESSDGYDVIFMDLSMPVMDGFEAIREIRRMETERRPSDSPSGNRGPAYIIALTGLASNHDEEDAFAAGADEFITKPFQFDMLSKLLQERESATP